MLERNRNRTPFSTETSSSRGSADTGSGGRFTKSSTSPTEITIPEEPEEKTEELAKSRSE